MYEISLKNVSFKYNESEVYSLLNIDLNIKKGEIVVLCGESGCGKSTIIRLINGLIPFYYHGQVEGEVTVQNHKVSDGNIYDLGSRVSTVFQNPRSQFYCVEVKSELAFGAENLNIPNKEIRKRIDDITVTMHMENLIDRTMFQLSGGEKQKIACASVSVTDNKIIVLDEPSSNLDMYAIEELKKMLVFWKSQGKTIVIAEHRLNYLKDIAERYIFMKKGQIKEEFSGDTFNMFSTDKLNAMGLRSISYNDLQIQNRTQSDKSLVLRDFYFKYRRSKVPSLTIDELKIPGNAVIAVIGRNGAGKSTFIRNFCGLEKKGKGILIDCDLKLKSKKRLNSSFLVMQDVNHQLFTESVLEEIALSSTDLNEENMDRLLKEFDLEDFKNRHPMSLSGGQKQRVAVASAIASDRKFIAFDEPTSGLDYRHMKQVAKCIKTLQKMDKTIFIITHDLELIYSCCNYVIHIEDGKIKEQYYMNEENKEKINEFYNVNKFMDKSF